MSWLYRRLVRPVLFGGDPEEVHERTLRLLAWTGRQELLCEMVGSFLGAPELPVEAFGLRFPNPVGLAAGMDKFAEAVPIWPALGFGFSELGAVTWHAQPGNPPPRIFRLPADEALINRMGFNNPGAEALAGRLRAWREAGRWPGHPVGINLGKSKVTPLQDAAEDYASSFRALRDQADFFVVNVSSPNTPNLRKLQDKAALDEILAAIQEIQSSAARPESRVERPNGGSDRTSHIDPRTSNIEVERPESALARGGNPPSARPVLVKVSPDLAFEALDEILQLVGPRRVAGIIATNTTITRPEASTPPLQRLYAEPGGLSGRPLRARSTGIIRHLYRQTRGALPIIGVGGIFTADDAWEKIMAGASLVQVYTGLVYEGPGMARRLVVGLRERLAEHGFEHPAQAVGQAGR